jgi:hypothetical protein
LGDTEIGVTGLLNNPDVATGNVGAYVPGTTTPEQVVAMFNAVLEAAWAATQYARIPNRILVPPTLFAALISTQLPHTDKNLLNFVLENSLTRANGGFLEIYPCKYLTGAMEKIVAYTKARDCVRFPLVQLQSLPVQFRDYMQIVPYYGALGAVEFVRPEMVYYGILA